MKPLRLGICADFREEQWPSMDRVASMLYRQLQRSHTDSVHASMLCPPFSRRLTRVALAGRLRPAVNGDRFLNRFWDYPRHVGRAPHHDVFHVVDHSYAHLVHALPAERTVVTCHDLDAFRSIISPDREARSAAFQAATRRILAGLQRAACVTCDTAAVRDELAAHRLVREDRLVVVPLGAGDAFLAAADAGADREAARLTQSPPAAVELLHVGSTVARKRIDVLLRVSAALHQTVPGIRLVRVGDALSPEQQRLAGELGLAGRIVSLDRVDERTLAALYRRAAVVLQPSEREGFGLPLIEAMACGTPVVASDITALREVGGRAVEYCPAGDVEHWCGTVARLLSERRDAPPQWQARCAQARLRASHFTWQRFAASMAGIYESLADPHRPPEAVADRRSSIVSADPRQFLENEPASVPENGQASVLEPLVAAE
jgi:glycosyltransferase involved in cell wall biosynthesis